MTFARIEMESRDIEPWADLLRALRDDHVVDEEGAYWLVKCYNGFDDLGSASGVARRWPGPDAWAADPAHAGILEYPCTQERRGLRGGRVAWHLDSYVANLAGQTQQEWLHSGYRGDNPEDDFLRVLAHVRAVWGVGRQTAFEWAEFAAKVLEVPITAPDAQLWESEGPRRSLQRLYGNPTPDLGWLNDRAHECRELIRDAGVDLAWEDFETIICDFNVMRDGRYYPGRHLASLREELNTIPDGEGEAWDRAWEKVVPFPWSSIPPGIDKTLAKVYRDTGEILSVERIIDC